MDNPNCLLLVLIGRTHTRLARVGVDGGASAPLPGKARPDLQPAPPIAHDALLSPAGSPDPQHPERHHDRAAQLLEPLAAKIASWIRAALLPPGTNADALSTRGSVGRARVVIASADDRLAQGVARRLAPLDKGEGVGVGVGVGVVADVSTLCTPAFTSRGDGHAIPIVVEGGSSTEISADRLLAALGASARLGQAVVVIDAGTLLTIDLCDRHGVLIGSAVAPGLGALLEATHRAAASTAGPHIPLVARPPTATAIPAGPMSLSAGEATLLGAVHAARGFVRYQIELMAEVGGVYPRVVATGPDAALLFDNDEIVEHVVPDLGLVGMLEAWYRLNSDEDALAATLSADELADEDEAHDDEDAPR